MIKRLLVFLLFLLSIHFSFSQNYFDSVPFSELMDQAKTLKDNSKYEASEAKYREALQVAEKTNSWHQIAAAKTRLIEIAWRMQKYDESMNQSKLALAEIKRHLSPDGIECARIYKQMGTIKLFQADYDSATHYLLKAARVFELKGDDGLSDLGSIYNNLAAIYSQKGDLQLKEKYINRSLEVDLVTFGEGHIYVGMDYNNLGAVYLEKSQFRRALVVLMKALDIFTKENIKGADYSDILYNLGTAYLALEEFEKANSFIYQGLINNKVIYGDAHADHIPFYVNLAESLFFSGLPDSSKYYYDQALAIDRNEIIDQKVRMDLIRNYAFFESSQGNNDIAVKYIKAELEKAYQISDRNNFINFLTYDLGRLYFLLKNYDQAKAYYEKALFLYGNADYEERNAMMRCYMGLAEIALIDGEYEEARNLIEKSIGFTAQKKEPLSKSQQRSYQVINSINFIKTAIQKAKILKTIYDNKGGDHVINELLKTYDEIELQMKGTRKSITSLSDKRQFQAFKTSFYEQAISAYKLAESLSKQSQFHERMFYFSESAKSGILSDILNGVEAGKWSAVPDSLTNLEIETRGLISLYKTKLNEINAKKSVDFDSVKAQFYHSKIFSAQMTLDNLIKTLSAKYPRYYEIRFDDEIISLKEVQEQLSKGDVLLEYFLGDSVSYAFLVSKNEIDIKVLPPRVELEKLSGNFRNLINVPDKTNERDKDSLYMMGRDLFTVLIAPFDSALKKLQPKNLVIIPDTELGYLPFELLIKEDVASNKPVHYLINDYNISYGYSATLLFKPQRKTTTDSYYLSFGPTYVNTPDTSSKVVSTNNRKSDALVPLYWNEEEASLLGMYMSGDAILGENATESVFKLRAKEANILHLAMHAFVDDENPMNSRLVFYQNNDNTEDGSLHTFELYNMQLNADLAVLSACETGYGKMVHGEGIVSLARGFAYAGVPSVVMSHWQVDDRSTSLLMKHFYRFLADGDTKGSALRKAKNAYLLEADEDKKHPFYWGAFVVIGDDSPIVNNSNLYWPVGLGFLLLGIILTVIVRKRSGRSPNRNY